MVASMTAFARKEQQTANGSLVWEIRALNQRFLELNFKLPEEWRFLEPQLRELIKHFLHRGKVECILRYQQNFDAAQTFQLNEPLGKALCHALTQINEWIRHPATVSPFDILSWPGMIQADPSVQQTLSEDITCAFQETLKELNQARQREGAALKNHIIQLLNSADSLIDKIKMIAPSNLQAQKDKWRARLTEFENSLEQARLEQEMVILATKMDVQEELDRLDTHIKEMRRILEKEKTMGRQLDFLLQEILRETNTLGSKISDTEIAHSCVDLKVVIEQMREQTQNIE